MDLSKRRDLDTQLKQLLVPIVLFMTAISSDLSMLSALRALAKDEFPVLIYVPHDDWILAKITINILIYKYFTLHNPVVGCFLFL